ncbi:hypothetical protein LEP1GSC008_0650 [Leptospira kirschneri serovar Bulgarica str. Nikolaevo]|uniref:Uncharacterized protein n=2 Tax=Leptospira kirschneri TaxID=29507 RepID=A0A0E2B578_9LEPT|nr:hypothetical protein LEP1GSC081_4168 [Leptospira kirschneri str. H1]EMK21374.1 hypothetical protein LEP1GSC008_0650 [Leptospira kirschneri serovar Bulgarica str. Nikolaevo]
MTGAESLVPEKQNRINNSEYNKNLKCKKIFSPKAAILKTEIHCFVFQFSE